MPLKRKGSAGRINDRASCVLEAENRQIRLLGVSLTENVLNNSDVTWDSATETYFPLSKGRVTSVDQ